MLEFFSMVLPAPSVYCQTQVHQADGH